MTAVIQTSHAPTRSERLKDAGGVAFVALVLGIPMIGLTTVDAGGMLEVRTRWAALGLFILLAFLGRLLFAALGDRLRARQRSFVRVPAWLCAHASAALLACGRGSPRSQARTLRPMRAANGP